MRPAPPRRLRRLAEELEESGLPPDGDEALRAILIEEVDYALRPDVHERRVPSSGTILRPSTEPGRWQRETELEIIRMAGGRQPLPVARRFADGMSSWLLRFGDERPDEWLLFDRPASSERDLVVLSQALDATVVQRHPSGAVRVAGSFGVLRWEAVRWHHEPPLGPLVDAISALPEVGKADVLEAMLEFAVHDLGSRGIGALLVYRPDHQPGPPVEERLATPPPLHIRTAFHLAPLRHALAQVDGAAVFDGDGVLRQLGVRLVPSKKAERTVEGLGGTRHTSGLRYSYDDPSATVIAVSEDGPVSVLRGGALLGRSADESADEGDGAGDKTGAGDEDQDA